MDKIINSIAELPDVYKHVLGTLGVYLVFTVPRSICYIIIVYLVVTSIERFFRYRKGVSEDEVESSEDEVVNIRVSPKKRKRKRKRRGWVGRMNRKMFVPKGDGSSEDGTEDAEKIGLLLKDMMKEGPRRKTFE